MYLYEIGSSGPRDLQWHHTGHPDALNNALTVRDSLYDSKIAYISMLCCCSVCCSLSPGSSVLVFGFVQSCWFWHVTAKVLPQTKQTEYVPYSISDQKGKIYIIYKSIFQTRNAWKLYPSGWRIPLIYGNLPHPPSPLAPPPPSPPPPPPPPPSDLRLQHRCPVHSTVTTAILPHSSHLFMLWPPNMPHPSYHLCSHSNVLPTNVIQPTSV